MKTEDIERLRKSALYWAKRLGFSSVKDDIAQEVLMGYLNGKNSKQTVQQAVICAVRRMIADPRALSFIAKRNLAFAVSFCLKYGNSETGGMDNGSVLMHAISVLTDTHRVVVTLLYLWGLNEKEIGFVLGVTESQVSRIKTSAIKMIKQRIRAKSAD